MVTTTIAAAPPRYPFALVNICAAADRAWPVLVAEFSCAVLLIMVPMVAASYDAVKLKIGKTTLEYVIRPMLQKIGNEGQIVPGNIDTKSTYWVPAALTFMYDTTLAANCLTSAQLVVPRVKSESRTKTRSRALYCVHGAATVEVDVLGALVVVVIDDGELKELLLVEVNCESTPVKMKPRAERVMVAQAE